MNAEPVCDDDSHGPLVSRTVWGLGIACLFVWGAIVYLGCRAWRWC